MYKVESKIVIDSPVENVWSVLADFGQVSKWAPSVTHSYSTSVENSGPDAARHCDVKGFGGVEENITEWNEGRNFSYSVTGVGPISEANSTWSVTPMGDKTQVYVDFRYVVRFGFVGAMMNSMMMRRKIRQGLDKTLEGLKQHIKTGELIGPEFQPVSAG